MKIFLKTHGCPKNEADSRVISGIFRDRGHALTDNPGRADIAVINTCGFILDAARESIDSLVHYAGQYKKENPGLRVYGMGCLIQRYHHELIKEMPEIDGWIGLDTLEETADFLLDGTRKKQIPIVPRPIFNRCPETTSKTDRVFEYVKIGDGCERSCAFCAIPTFKGRHISRAPADIRNEVENLIKAGTREIIIVDQDITQYEYHGNTLSALLKTLDAIEGDYWIRLMYIHPDHIDDELVKTVRDSEHIIPYFDLPVQHGSDRVLRYMGRKRTSRELQEIILKIREEIPGASIRTTIMVGFPGEGDAEFEELITFMEAIEFDKVGFFKFSMEHGTPVEEMKLKAPPRETADERLEEIKNVQEAISERRNSSLLGKSFKVLVEGKEGEMTVCRSYRDAPEIDGEVFINNCQAQKSEFITARITQYSEYDLEAEVI